MSVVDEEKSVSATASQSLEKGLLFKRWVLPGSPSVHTC